jgi:NAD(P)H-nitrite reductase large subunit
MMRHVIIGAGPAGIMAAKTIRAQRPDDEIIVLSTDTTVHSRCMLHKFIDGERDNKTVSFVDEDFFEANNIKWVSGVKDTKVDAASHTVSYDDDSVKYDKLLIATGADSVVPPIGGLRTARNVFGLRNLSDAIQIKRYAASAQKVAVVGAGLVGLDAAYPLVELGKSVTVIEMVPQMLALNLDAHAAAEYQRRFEEHGVTFLLGKQVSGTVMSEDGKVTALEIATGERVECDMVIVAVGVRPSIKFLDGSGVFCNRSVKVDSYMRTSDPDVFAAGDAAGLSGIWPNAMKQGKTAGLNMCGGSVPYTDRYALKNTINFFGLLSMSVGKLNPSGGDVVYTREDKNRYQKVITNRGLVKGVILQGDISYSGFWQYLIKNQIDISRYEPDIWSISYADFCGFDPNGEYVWENVS